MQDVIGNTAQWRVRSLKAVLSKLLWRSGRNTEILRFAQDDARQKGSCAKKAGRWVPVLLIALTTQAGLQRASGQASAIPSAASKQDDANGTRGRKLLDGMVAALGGDKWLQREDWIEYGKGSTFYKSAPNPFEFEFEEYYRAQPFGERVVIVSKNANALTAMIGVPIAKTKRDIATVWTQESGYEITYTGKKELPKIDIADFQRRRKHTLDVLVNDWLKRPGTLVTYEGTYMYERRIAEKVSVLTADNDSMTLELNADTHLPMSSSFVWRNETYKDLDTDDEQYDNYQLEGGIMTPLTVTRLHNGDIVSQRYLTKVVYNTKLAPDLFNPDRPLEKKAK